MVYVSCGGYINKYENMKEVMNFFRKCAAYCEGSEQQRYMTVILNALDSMTTGKRCINDGMRTFGVDFDISNLSGDDLQMIQKDFHITMDELLLYKKRYDERKKKGMI